MESTIRKLEVEDVVLILKNPKFKSGKMFQFDKGTWVQFLVQNINNKNMLIVGRVVDNKLLDFSVTVYNGKIAFLLYISDDVLDDAEYKQASFNWARKFGGGGRVKNMKTWDGV